MISGFGGDRPALGIVERTTERDARAQRNWRERREFVIAAVLAGALVHTAGAAGPARPGHARTRLPLPAARRLQGLARPASLPPPRQPLPPTTAQRRSRRATTALTHRLSPALEDRRGSCNARNRAHANRPWLPRKAIRLRILISRRWNYPITITPSGRVPTGLAQRPCLMSSRDPIRGATPCVASLADAPMGARTTRSGPANQPEDGTNSPMSGIFTRKLQDSLHAPLEIHKA